MSAPRQDPPAAVAARGRLSRSPDPRPQLERGHPPLTGPPCAPWGAPEMCCVPVLLSGWEGRGEGETPQLLLLRPHLGIIKSATGKRTAGATGLLNPKHGPQLSQRARVMLGRMVAK